jgi:hypothetical protein
MVADIVPVPFVPSSMVPVTSPPTVGGALALLTVNDPLCGVAQFPVVVKVPLKVPLFNVPLTVLEQAPGILDVRVALREFPLTVPFKVPVVAIPPNWFPQVPVTAVPFCVKETATGALVPLLTSVPEYVEASVTGELLLVPLPKPKPHARRPNEVKQSVAAVSAIASGLSFMISPCWAEHRKE